MFLQKTLRRVCSMSDLELQLDALLSNPSLDYFYMKNTANGLQSLYLRFDQCGMKTVIQNMERGFDVIFMHMEDGTEKVAKLTERADLEGFEYYVERVAVPDEFSPSQMQQILPLKEVFFEKIAGRIVTLSVDESQSILDLKHSLITLHNAPVDALDEMVFIYEGNLIMDNDNAFEMIQDQGTVKVYCKGPGGGKWARAAEGVAVVKDDIQKQLNDSIILLKQYDSAFVKSVLEEVEKTKQKLEESGDQAIKIALQKLSKDDLKDLCTSSHNNVNSRMQLVTTLMMKTHFEKLEQTRTELKQAEHTLVTMVNLAMHTCYNQSGNLSWKTFEADVVDALTKKKPEQTQTQVQDQTCTIQ